MNMNNKREETPYLGSLIFTNGALSFSGMTIQLRNVTRFAKHDIKRYHRVSLVLLIACVILFMLSLSWKGWGFLSLITALIAAYGIYEYFRPKLYALVIELSSAYRYMLSSTDKEGIEIIYAKISEAMGSPRPVNFTANFRSDKIIFGDDIAGDKYEFNDSNIDKAGSFNNNS